MINIFNKPKTQKRDKVEFLNIKELKLIFSPLTDKALDSVCELIDRYVDAKMKELIVDKINESSFDENTEIKLKGVLEFKNFLNSFRIKK